MSPYRELAKLASAAIAFDGGSIWLAISDNHVGGTQFKINRKISDRGTPAFNRVTTDKGHLSDSETHQLTLQLQRILATTEPAHESYSLLATFVAHLVEGERAQRTMVRILLTALTKQDGLYRYKGEPFSGAGFTLAEDRTVESFQIENGLIVVIVR